MTESTDLRTEWNGEPCRALRGTITIADAPEFPAYWARHLLGLLRQVVQVEYAGRVFYLDDADGQGWHKVTHGGGPYLQHRNVTAEPNSFTAYQEQP
ncbi:hypothetical protein [Streptomyces sp. NPDC060194]|uniref:hypothetical protein n=1 Tax=Streptomyces sp. NPDC060194 TaxID=3347069 RepID=UPI00365439B8